MIIGLTISGEKPLPKDWDAICTKVPGAKLVMLRAGSTYGEFSAVEADVEILRLEGEVTIISQ